MFGEGESDHLLNFEEPFCSSIVNQSAFDRRSTNVDYVVGIVGRHFVRQIVGRMFDDHSRYQLSFEGLLSTIIGDTKRLYMLQIMLGQEQGEERNIIEHPSFPVITNRLKNGKVWMSFGMSSVVSGICWLGPPGGQ